MKKQFEEVKVEIIFFETEDVITTSDPKIEDDGYEDGEL